MINGHLRTASSTLRSVIVCSVVFAFATIADFFITFIAYNFFWLVSLLLLTRNTFPYAEVKKKVIRWEKVFLLYDNTTFWFHIIYRPIEMKRKKIYIYFFWGVEGGGVGGWATSQEILSATMVGWQKMFHFKSSKTARKT